MNLLAAAGWVPALPPRVPELVLGEGAAALALGWAAVAALEQGARFSVWCEPDALLVKALPPANDASSHALPWVEGARYFGRAEQGLHLPTHSTPRLPIALLVARCAALGLASPVLVLPEGRLLSLAAPRACEAAELRALLVGWRR